MTEQLAPGRFSWCKLRVTYYGGEVVDEDRTDGAWWENLPKERIRLLTVVPTSDNLSEHVEPVSIGFAEEVGKRYGFFHFKRAKITFGLISKNTIMDEQAYVIGFVDNFNGSGDGQMIEVYPDFSHASFRVHVGDYGLHLNLEQQGIEMDKIGDLIR